MRPLLKFMSVMRNASQFCSIQTINLDGRRTSRCSGGSIAGGAGNGFE
jgi:hypothetical protein